MQSRANASGHGLDSMACKAGKGTDRFAAIPNRRNRARGPTKAQRPQRMTQRKRLTHAQHPCRCVCGANAVSEIATWVVLTASIERFPPPRWIGDLPTKLSEKLIKATVFCEIPKTDPCDTSGDGRPAASSPSRQCSRSTASQNSSPQGFLRQAGNPTFVRTTHQIPRCGAPKRINFEWCLHATTFPFVLPSQAIHPSAKANQRNRS